MALVSLFASLLQVMLVGGGATYLVLREQGRSDAGIAFEDKLHGGAFLEAACVVLESPSRKGELTEGGMAKEEKLSDPQGTARWLKYLLL